MAACWPLQMPPSAKAVLISLADNANDQGACWPSIETISERTCISRRSVIDAIAWLEMAGALVANRDNGRHSNYVITPAKFRADTPRESPRTAQRKRAQEAEPVQMPHQCGNDTGANAAQTGANAAPAPVTMPHKPVRQPHTNRKNRHLNRQEPSVEPRAARLADDWLTDELMAWARKAQPTWPEDHCRLVAEKFADYWRAQPGAKGRKLDWPATWRNWVRNEKPLTGVQAKQSASDPDSWRAQVAALEGEAA